jgi:predicted acylesterase/phospholipase RssA
MRENIIFYKFDLYNNFILKNTNRKEIEKIIKKIKTNYNLNKENNFMNSINPYKIERVVFAGGGSKGMIYLGVMFGLFLSGNIYYLNYFSGTSIGALTATLLAMITPNIEVYDEIKNKPLEYILKDNNIVSNYKKCINFIIERFIKRPIDTFYKSPQFTFQSIYETMKKIIYENYLYDFENSGFGIWFALICKYICKVMKNELDNLILIKDKTDKFIEIDEIDFESDFEGYKIERFFTFEEYNKLTGKSIVLTGTKWDPIETVYYSKEDYKDISIIKACNASSCLPGVFKPVIINDTNNLDGGLFDNYPLTYGDKKINNRIVEYHNKTIGFLIDDQNSIIEPYEIIRELWIIYNGFIDSSELSYLIDSSKYNEMTEIFFEIRLILYKLLYSPNIEIKNFIHNNGQNSLTEYNIIKNDILTKASEDGRFKKLKIIDIEQILNNLIYNEKEMFKIGKKTNLDDIYSNIFTHGNQYNILNEFIISEQLNLDDLLNTELYNSELLLKYKEILNNLLIIISYFELKGLFYSEKNIENISENFINIMIELKSYIVKLNEISEEETIKINRKNKSDKSDKFKNYIKNTIDIANTTLQKILLKVTNKNKNISQPKKESYYDKIVKKIYNSNISDIIYKYLCIANDKICSDEMNNLRTVKLNTFETNTLHFEIDLELISRLIFEGYSKTIKYYVNILRLMELIEKEKINDEYLESYEVKYKNFLHY